MQLGATKPEQIIENLKGLDAYNKIKDDREVQAKIEEILDNKPAVLVSLGRDEYTAEHVSKADLSQESYGRRNAGGDLI